MPGRPLFEKYRPRSLSEVVGQEHVVAALREMLRRGELPHLLFVGPPGTGKTSVAHALARELGWQIIELNASDERGINVIRQKVKALAFSAGSRIILMDEADSLTDDAQHALRRIMEKASPTVRFILTANEEYKIIDPIKSRCAVFRFRKLSPKELLTIVVRILKGEGALKQVDEEVKQALRYLVEYADGDARKAVNMIQSLLLAGREVTKANIMMLVPPDLMQKALKAAWEQGDFEGALALLEDALIEDKLDPTLAVRQLYRALKLIDVPRHVKARLYVRLAEAERGIKMGCHPLIQLASFLASAWAYKYAPGGVREG